MNLQRKVGLRVYDVRSWRKCENVKKTRKPFTIAGAEVYGLKVKGFPSGLG